MIGDNIKRLMKENGYTQKQLAIRSKCTESAISRYIRNKREPSIDILKNLAISLGVTVGELIDEIKPNSEVLRSNSKVTVFDKITENEDVFIEWINKNFHNLSPEEMPCKAENDCDGDCDKCFKEWLKEDAND